MQTRVIKSFRTGLLAAVILSICGLGLAGRGFSPGEMLAILGRFKPLYLGLAFVLSFGLWVAEAVRVQVILDLLGEKMPFHRALTVALSTAFALGVTPFGAGGPPVQTYLLTRYGISLDKSLTVAAVQAAWTLGFFLPVLPLALWLGFGHNPGEVGSLLLLGISWLLLLVLGVGWLLRYPRFIYLATVRLCRFVPGRLSRRRHSLARRVYHEVLLFSRTFALMLRSKARGLIPVTLWTVVTWGCVFLNGPLLLEGIGIPAPWLQVVAQQIVIYFVISTIPLPGGSGLAEMGAALVFKPLLPSHFLGGFIAVWRFFTYYLQIIIGGPVFWQALPRRSNP